MPDADFWLIRKGSDKTVGKPVKEFDPSRIGVKVVRTDVLDPKYLYYVMMNLHNQGMFARLANGTTNLVNITVNDIANIPLGQQNESLNEFTPSNGDDREPDEEEILKQLAAQWWLGTEQQMAKAQKTLAVMGWDIGQDESGDDDAGVFLIRTGDENGDSYIAFNHSDLELNEGYSQMKIEELITEGKAGLWANIHAKRDRIKKGSGERMRKPGSKGAPSSQDFKDAANEAANPAQQAAIAIAKKKDHGIDEAKDPWKEYEFIHNGQKIGYIYSRTGQPPFTTRRKVGRFIKQMNHNSLKDAQNYLINKFLGRSTYDNMSHYGTTPQQGIDEDWQKVNKKDKTDGMSKKAVSAYRTENPGSKLKTAVTTKPSKLKKGSKAAKRRKSFCARMKGMKKSRTSAKTARDPNSNINKSLRRWNCESIEQMQELVMIAEQFIAKHKK